MIDTIRWATESDIDTILDINKSFFTSYTHDESFFREGLHAGRVAIARVGSTPAGYLIYQVLWGNTPFLALLRVLPDFRGNGLGTKMLVLCEEKLRAEGFKTLISSSEKVNEEGNAFHQKMDFKPIGTVQMIYGDENFYRKDL